jgi:anti-sigma28 factor (negative regulator of flagellin synthesis)
MRISDRYQRLMDGTSGVSTKRTAGADGGRPSSSTASSGKAGSTAGANVEVKVSDRAQELNAGVQRLEQLKSAIRDGSFKVDPQAIAAKLVGEE